MNVLELQPTPMVLDGCGVQNLEKLEPLQLQLLVGLLGFGILPWNDSYMVEVRLDDPTAHLLYGGEGLVRHSGGGSSEYALHLNDPDWAVIHVQALQARGYDLAALATAGLAYARMMLGPDEVINS